MKKLILLSFLAFTFVFVFVNAQTGEIRGRIARADGAPVKGVAVIMDRLGGALPDTVFTNEQGVYNYLAATGSTYLVRPHFDRDHRNGLDQGDLHLISMYILDTIAMLSPYQLIAADADNSGFVSILDMIRISNVMDGKEATFRNNTSWRFIRSDYEFADPANPWANPLDTIDYASDIQPGSVTVLDFVAIKVGDVNMNAVLQLDELSTISGSIGVDLDGDCMADNFNNNGLGTIVKLSNEAITIYYRATQQGQYSFYAPPGNYKIEVSTITGYWELCTGFDNIQLAENEQKTIDLVISPVVNCSYLEVDLATAYLRRCFDSNYTVRYCNKGTIAAEDAYIEIELDPFLELNSSTIPYTNTNSNLYTFQIGNVAVGACGEFYLNVNVSCDSELRQTLCSEANIYPRDLCEDVNSLWDGSSLNVDAACTGDSITFRIKNEGAAMTQPTRYIVIEDDLVMREATLQLAEGQELTLPFKANGATLRLEVTQPVGHPFSTRSSAHMEGCSDNVNVSYGFVTQFPEDDESPYTSIDCRVNRGSFDPNDKQVFPEGVSESHFVEANTDLEYLIRFQNTGTDTAFNVIIRDTLSQFLDPESVAPGASSHPYQLSQKDGALSFIFENIMLPDSNINEPASHGFVKFKVKQQKDNPAGTVIPGKASIYFDFNEPVVTNIVWNTIEKDFLGLVNTTSNNSPELIEVQISPNPIHTAATFTIKESKLKNCTLQIFNINGKLQHQQAFNGNQSIWNAQATPGGIYFYQILSESKMIARGKVVVVKY